MKLEFRKGGKLETKFYQVWVNMLQRCRNPNGPDWKHYGGRGIFVCDEWTSFESFKTDMFESYGYGVEIDRIDNMSGYSKANCRFVTHKVNMSNTRKVKSSCGYLRNFCLPRSADRLLPSESSRWGLSMTKFVAAAILFAARHPDFMGHGELTRVMTSVPQPPKR